MARYHRFEARISNVPMKSEEEVGTMQESMESCATRIPFQRSVLDMIELRDALQVAEEEFLMLVDAGGSPEMGPMRATCWPRPQARFRPTYCSESYQRQLRHCPYPLVLFFRSSFLRKFLL
jgi:hypothetical protein